MKIIQEKFLAHTEAKQMTVLEILLIPNSKCYKKLTEGFPGGSVVKNPPANAGEMDLSLGRGRPHMTRSN